MCRAILQDDQLVFFNSSRPEPEDQQEYLVQSLWPELEGLGWACTPAMHALLCHSAFPGCNPSGLGPAPKPVCRYVSNANRCECVEGSRKKAMPHLQGALPRREGGVLSKRVAGPGGQRLGPVRPVPLCHGFQQSQFTAAQLPGLTQSSR